MSRHLRHKESFSKVWFQSSNLVIYCMMNTYMQPCDHIRNSKRYVALDASKEQRTENLLLGTSLAVASILAMTTLSLSLNASPSCSTEILPSVDFNILEIDQVKQHMHRGCE